MGPARPRVHHRAHPAIGDIAYTEIDWRTSRPLTIIRRIEDTITRLDHQHHVAATDHQRTTAELAAATAQAEQTNPHTDPITAIAERLTEIDQRLATSLEPASTVDPAVGPEAIEGYELA